MMRAAYLDFYTKSLQNPDADEYLPYSSKLRSEQKYHDLITNKMMSKDIYPDGIDIDPLEDSSRDDLESSGIYKQDIYTMKAG